MFCKIKLTLHGAKPVVNRTVAVGAGMDLYDAALVFITAMGWRGGRDHYYVIGSGTGDEETIERDEEESYSVGDLQYMNLTLYYDRFIDWRVDIEFKGKTDEKALKVLAYKGECPNQILSGIKDFNKIRKAAADPSDPYRDQAEAWLGTVPPYDIDTVNKRLGEGKMAMPAYSILTENSLSDPMISAMNLFLNYMGSKRAASLEFRCPECGSVCDGRTDMSLPPSPIKGLDQYPARIVCPKCRTENVLYIKNDGFRIGYHENGSSRPQNQQTELYDALARRDDVRSPFEEAEYQAELGIIYDMYEYRKDNSGKVEECLNGLDKKDPRYGEISALCRESIILQAGKLGRKVPEDTSGFSGTRGALAMAEMCFANEKPHADLEKMIPKAIGMMESDPEAKLAERCRAAAHIATAAKITENREALEWAASILEKTASEADKRAEKLTSAEWHDLCFLMETVIGSLYGLGMTKEADAALKSMSVPFADCWNDRMPAAVRNIVAFRRAVLFLSAGGDREQAFEDLGSIMDSIRKTEDNGILTMRRMPYVSMLRAHFGKVKKDELVRERTAVVRILASMMSAGLVSEKEMSCAVTDFLRAYVGKGYSYAKAREEFLKHGITIDSKMPDVGKFDLEDVWYSRLVRSI